MQLERDVHVHVCHVAVLSPPESPSPYKGASVDKKEHFRVKKWKKCES